MNLYLLKYTFQQPLKNKITSIVIHITSLLTPKTIIKVYERISYIDL